MRPRSGRQKQCGEVEDKVVLGAKAIGVGSRNTLKQLCSLETLESGDLVRTCAPWGKIAPAGKAGEWHISSHHGIMKVIQGVVCVKPLPLSSSTCVDQPPPSEGGPRALLQQSLWAGADPDMRQRRLKASWDLLAAAYLLTTVSQWKNLAWVIAPSRSGVTSLDFFFTFYF